MNVFVVTSETGDGCCGTIITVERVFHSRELANAFIASKCTNPRDLCKTLEDHSFMCPAESYSVDGYEVDSEPV